jgi:hypothetical protein
MIFGGTLSELLEFSLITLIYKQFINKENVVKLQKDLVRLTEWAAENGMEIN